MRPGALLPFRLGAMPDGGLGANGMINVIETEGLTKAFGDVTAVRDLALCVPAGCVYGFLGPNGAGKTTTMRMLLGLMRSDRGRIDLFGHDIRRERLAALRSVGALIEYPSLYEHLSGAANLRLTCTLLGHPLGEVDRVLELVDLKKAAGRRVEKYSLGMKQRLALARAMLGAPKLLILDEPTNGLDPDGIAEMRSLLRSLPNETGSTIFVSSHLLGEVEQIATVTGLMHSGQLVIQEALSTLLAKSTILTVEVSDATKAARALTTLGRRTSKIDGHRLTITVPADIRSSVERQRAYAGETNEALMEAGVSVSQLAYERLSLENLYHDYVSGKEVTP